MMIDLDFVGVRFEWQGKTRDPFATQGGLDCAGLTNYYHEVIHSQPLPPALISNDGWDRKSMPKYYILSKAHAYEHLVNELQARDATQATMIIYQGYADRMCLAAISTATPEIALVFGADLRSRWAEIAELDDVTYWKLN